MIAPIDNLTLFTISGEFRTNKSLLVQGQIGRLNQGFLTK